MKFFGIRVSRDEIFFSFLWNYEIIVLALRKLENIFINSCFQIQNLSHPHEYDIEVRFRLPSGAPGQRIVYQAIKLDTCNAVIMMTRSSNFIWILQRQTLWIWLKCLPIQKLRLQYNYLVVNRPRWYQPVAASIILYPSSSIEYLKKCWFITLYSYFDGLFMTISWGWAGILF